METSVRTPQQLFHLSQHLTVPLFQRRYVWEAEHQWQPLWEDITRTAALRAAGKDVTHFLGAAVLQATPIGVGDLPRWALIDGQQRVTTLQIVIDAVSAVLATRGRRKLHGRLDKLTHNDEVDVDRPEDILKLRHDNDDGPVFREVMTAPAPVDHDDLADPQARLSRAHRFFSDQAAAWLGEDDEKAESLADTLLHGLELVAITLQAEENSQEIFETLNARGTPLTAADLIKNFLIQRIQAQGGDADEAYHRYWKLFETRFWEKEVSVGRMYVTRSTLFLQQWLSSRAGEEVPQARLFPLFKDFVDHRADGAAVDLLAQIVDEAQVYQGWIAESTSDKGNLSPVGMSVYRYAQNDVQLAMPFLIWLHNPRRKVPRAEIDRALLAMESWVVRRLLLRLTTADMGRAVSGLMSSLEGAPVTEVGARTEAYLSRLSTASTYWPGDDELSDGLKAMPAYKAYRRSRLRMVLEAVEDDLRGYVAHSARGISGARVARESMHIEHLLPQAWRATWPVPPGDLAAEIERDAHVHRLGNLTLLTNRLNSSVSNRAWEGDNGKRAALKKHDENLLTRRARDRGESWDEEAIEERTTEMVGAVLRAWPVPDGHQGTVADRAPVTEPISVSLRDLVAAGLLAPGTELRARHGDGVATVLPNGQLRVGDKTYTSPSGAGYALVGGGVNGWWFWFLPDGRLLMDLRTEYREMSSRPGSD